MTAADVVERFYRAFAARDGATMAASYAPDATFSDPVFPDLDGRKAGAMWRMLCERGTDLVLSHRVVSAEGDRVVVRWDADYTFAATGRKVHNEVTATIDVKDGRIVAHQDAFDFHAWSRQALGLPGLLLGWSSFLRNQVRGTAAQQLDRYVTKHG
jgi:ketosteroid isomerase-like protein